MWHEIIWLKMRHKIFEFPIYISRIYSYKVVPLLKIEWTKIGVDDQKVYNGDSWFNTNSVGSPAKHHHLVKHPTHPLILCNSATYIISSTCSANIFAFILASGNMQIQTSKGFFNLFYMWYAYLDPHQFWL